MDTGDSSNPTHLLSTYLQQREGAPVTSERGGLILLVILCCNTLFVYMNQPTGSVAATRTLYFLKETTTGAQSLNTVPTQG